MENDAWTALNGKVYNMTSYVKFHPGGKESFIISFLRSIGLINHYIVIGVKDIMRIAGRDGTKLFSKQYTFEIMI